jgi:adenine-specific DNA-methyltransferase
LDTELVWDGKYTENGRRRAPARIALPFQVAETINETSQIRQKSLLAASGPSDRWKNRLIWGDKKYVLPSLLPEFAGQIDMIYIDPPFDTGENFSFTAEVPPSPRATTGSGLEFTKEPNLIELKAYRDTWGKGMDSYLQWLYDTLVLLRELLADTGSIFVHLDVHRGPYAKLLLDEIFGRDNFQNEIVWYYYNKLHDSRKRLLPKASDQILYYVKSKSSGYKYHPLKEPREAPVTKLKYRKVAGRIQNVLGPDGKAVTYISEERTIDNVWRIRALQPANKQEWVNFETQKPVDLIERILQLSSDEGDLILDCFCGSGTSLVAATRMRRRWIGCDLSRFAIHTTRKKLLNEPSTTAFDVLNLGRYERQLWQSDAFEADDERSESDAAAGQRSQQYTAFVLGLYHAQAITGHAWIHGLKAGRLVHVGSVDAPVTASDITQIAIESRKVAASAGPSGRRNAIDVLGWDFAFDVNEVIQQQAATARISLRFMRIPREVMDKQAIEQGDVRFFELGALGTETALQKRKAKLTLTSFVIPPDDVPEDIQRAVRHWSQWVDYWAVDWDNRDDTFHNEWQAFRTRTNPGLVLHATHEYDRPDVYKIIVKVVDILGNDTTKALTLRVP